MKFKRRPRWHLHIKLQDEVDIWLKQLAMPPHITNNRFQIELEEDGDYQPLWALLSKFYLPHPPKSCEEVILSSYDLEDDMFHLRQIYHLSGVVPVEVDFGFLGGPLQLSVLWEFKSFNHTNYWDSTPQGFSSQYHISSSTQIS